MNWQKKHQQKIESFPKDIQAAHKFSSKHRAQIIISNNCGCFYCISIFSPSQINQWIDKNEDEEGQTALCPKCGIYSVLGDKSGYDISEDFLQKMYYYWFES